MLVGATAISLIVWTFMFLVVFNFLPACVAYVNGHPDRHLLAVLNIVSLFSFALWIALMAWAASGTSSHPVVMRFVGSPQQRRRLVASVLTLVVAGVATTALTLKFA
ncbi:MAG: superinfection immunity protein [Sphingomonadales bacterium]|jgi:hypothetical protein